jgi:signal transduction histidine kinase
VAPALRFLSNEWKDKVQIEQKLAEHQTIWANKNKLIQVIVNLLQNSLDALKTKSFKDDEKPTIWIEGRSRTAAASCRSATTARASIPGSIWTRFSTRFSPPKTWAKAWAWA